MGTVRDLGLLMLRVGVGASCFSHGARSCSAGSAAAGSEETADGDGRHGLRARRAQRPTAGVLETVGGAMLALGLATGPVGAALTGNMITASCVHAPNGFFNTNGGYELPVTYALVGSTFALTGPGASRSTTRPARCSTGRGCVAVALVGALATAAYLVSTRSAVVAERDDERGVTRGA